MKRDQVILTREEIQQLLSQPNKKVPTGLRDFCIISILHETGMRVREMLDLQTNQLSPNGSLTFTRCHKAVDRFRSDSTQLAPSTLPYLHKWIALKPYNPLLFTTLHAKPLSDRYIRAMIKRRAKRAGITKDVHPYSFRHTFATNLYEEAKQRLGHINLNSTFFYIHPK